MIADPSVSRRKFEREVATAKAHKPFHEQGVWILRAEYPVVFAVLITGNPLPVLRGVICGVHIDFTDYDARPPSVRFVDPFSEAPLHFDKCPWKFIQTKMLSEPTNQTDMQRVEVTPLLQAFDMNKPFLCLPGVKEYHDSSAHSGDSWFLHRKKNMLVHILSILQQFGPAAIAYQAQVQVAHHMVPKLHS
jgi:hypothetical protein